LSSNFQQLLIGQIRELGIPHKPNGTLVCVEGPRFSNRIESEYFRQLGADVVGMTTCPEAVLPRELGMLYAEMVIVTDYNRWKDTVEGVSLFVVLVIGQIISMSLPI
jgi:5'-methylthioadenosine phosphorylase